ncbi:hypothetical protein [Microbacterium sp. NIBRBAC000506063]|uniref:hypothetical protein n=1 Tax=Microbacterium sp. NIBRBAC000506063 TaxID=2734618 RepID=UPI001BB697A9|nr:hypothetical protein [Microbacterium sp. NIBRBAC000506063]QTV79009.1 hypothetical protein KAE78_07500 [Microbacterium sp. NIBRBAC000506063]
MILSAPVIFTFGGLATGSLQDATLPFWLVSIGFLVLGVLFALRLPHVDTIVAVIGAGLMLLGAIDAGLLVLAFWMAGGLWLVTGSAAQWRATASDRSVSVGACPAPSPAWTLVSHAPGSPSSAPPNCCPPPSTRSSSATRS